MIELRHVADLLIHVAEPVEIGLTTAGRRRVVPISGGEVNGPGLRGRVLPIGAEFQSIRHDGVTELEARYVIETHDNARIYVNNTGLRHGSAAAMQKLRRGEPVDPDLIYFRTTPHFETAAEPYLWLTRHVFIATGSRHPQHVALSVYQLL
jgi:hypothetical protein